jgi:metallo-beta-lactamase class B
MKAMGVVLAALLSTTAAYSEPPALRADPPAKCDACEGWNAPREPFRLFGNSYFVGTAGLSAVLIASDQGLILLDGGLTQSASLIDANIRKLGFRTEEVKLIVNSHAHFDHAGGIAALQRVSRATVAASPSGAFAIEHGGAPADDPQYGFGREANAFPSVKHVRVVKDGEALRVGDLAITAHFTPGHTPGSTTWTWRSCEGARCLDLVYADSLNSISAPGFRFTGDAKHPSRAESFRASIAKVEALPCDIIVAVHPSLADLDGKLKRRAERSEPGSDPFVDPQGCRAYAAGARERLDQRLAEERRNP